MAKQIYLLEDNEDIRDIVSLILSGEEYKISAFPDVSTFKEALAAGTPDIFILDVMLPDGNGLEICSELKTDRRTGTVPVVMMSANFPVAHLCKICQAEDFISKPFDIFDFKQRIDKQFAHN